jgi:hypothetical protein
MSMHLQGDDQYVSTVLRQSEETLNHNFAVFNGEHVKVDTFA